MPRDPGCVFLMKQLHTDDDYLTPDGLEIRLLPRVRGSSLAYCTLPPGKTAQTVLYHWR